jgi:hypothetical protein
MSSFPIGDLTAVVRYGGPVAFPRAVPTLHPNCHLYSDRVVGNLSSVVSERKPGWHRWLHLPPHDTVTLEPEIGRLA